MFQQIEPFDGWLPYYAPDADEHSPFHGVEHNAFEYDRFIYTYEANPLWEYFGSESLLVKILYANYDGGYAILELLGEWNDLHLNDFKLLAENCLTYLADAGVREFVLICENVFHAHLDREDYYDAFAEELAEREGWLALLRARENVQAEFSRYGMSQYVHWSPALDELRWRKLKPWDLIEVVRASLARVLPPL